MRLLLLSRSAALYSTRRLVLAARAGGHSVDVVDPSDLCVRIGGRTPQLRYDARELPRYGAVIPRIGGGNVHGLAVLAALERFRCLNGVAAIRAAYRPSETLRLLTARRVPVPDTLLLRSVTGIEREIAALGGCPLVLKVAGGTHGIGTILCESVANAVSTAQTLLAMGQQVLLQRYVVTEGCSDIRALVVGGRCVAAMTRQARAGEFRANLHAGGEARAVKLSRREKRVAIRAAEALGLEVAGVDMLRGEELAVIEVNSSPGLEGIERVSEVDVAGAIIARATR